MAAWIATRPGERGGGAVASVMSLIPAARAHAMALLESLYAADLPLSRREVEMVTTVVSAVNRCFY